MCTNCNERQNQVTHICDECLQENCGCPVKDLSTDCVNFDQEDLKYEDTTVVPKNTVLTVALDNILQFLKVKIEELRNYFKIVNTGSGASIYSGNTLLGEKKLRKIRSSNNSVTIIEGSDDIDLSVIASTPPDGSETKLVNGTNTTVSGNGTTTTPYSINVVLDGSETKIVAGTNTTITGNGSTATPFIINSNQDNIVKQIVINEATLPLNYNEADVVNALIALPIEDRTILDTNSKVNIIVKFLAS